jgi:hypothetical protein
VASPRNEKHHAVVIRARNQDRGIARKKGTFEYDVCAAAESQQRSGRGRNEPAHFVDKHTGCIDHHARTNLEVVAPDVVVHRRAGDAAVRAQQRRHPGVIQHHRAARDRGPRQLDGKAGIVELIVVVDNAAA